MDWELSSRLGKDFPFVNDFYFQCGDGWYNLLRDLFTEITQAYAAHNLEPDIVPTQIKEKYATLRFYYGFGEKNPVGEKLTEVRNRVDEIVNKYEDLSETVCESCGQAGEIRNIDGWLAVLCDKCFESKQKK